MNDLLEGLAAESKSFPSLSLSRTGAGLYNLTQQNLEGYLDSGLAPQEAFKRELSDAINKVNYGQTDNMNALAGMVSLSTTSAKLWAIGGGNQKV